MRANGSLESPVRMQETAANTQPRRLPSTSHSVANMSVLWKDVSFIIFISVIMKLMSMFIVNN